MGETREGDEGIEPAPPPQDDVMSSPLASGANEAPGEAASATGSDDTTGAPDPWQRPAQAPGQDSAGAGPGDQAAPSQAKPPGWEWSREAPRPDGAAAGDTLARAAVLMTPGATVGLPPSPASVPEPPSRAGRAGLDLLALVLAVLGGLMGLVGAFMTELQSGGIGLVLVFLGAPVVEEALKPSGLYLLMVRWPAALRSRLHSSLLCAISGAVFGVVESLIYTEIYFPEGGENFVIFRFTVTPAMHALASGLVGYGLSQATLDWAVGKRPLPKETRNFFLAGMGLHATYNTGAVVLGLLGVLDFLDS